jgi:hypothetical protein
MIALGLTLCGGEALADFYFVYSDPGGLTCALTTFNPLPDPTPAYVIQKQNEGSAGSQFGIRDNSGLPFVGFTSNYLVIGALDNVIIAYPSCIEGDHVLMTLNWIAIPMDFTCFNQVEVIAAATSPLPGEIVTELCDFTLEAGHSWGGMPVGPDSDSCLPCPDVCPPTTCHVPVAERTWGAIKALYQ